MKYIWKIVLDFNLWCTKCKQMDLQYCVDCKLKKNSLLICISFEIFQNTGLISQPLIHVNSL